MLICVSNFPPYRGVVKDGDLNALSSKVARIQKRVDSLREQEETLDRLCAAMKKEHELAKKNPENHMYAYITRDDLLEIYGDDKVILTLRNFADVRQKITKTEENVQKHILKVHGRFKKVDVRLVTTSGEALQQKPQTVEDNEDSDKQLPLTEVAALTTSDIVKRRNRRRKPAKLETKDDDEFDEKSVGKKSTKDGGVEDKELDERRVLAKTLLGYRPPAKLIKRSFDDDCDTFECWYI